MATDGQGNAIVRVGLLILAIIGYLAIGLAVSSAASAVVLWATDGLPGEGDYTVFWQGQVGAAMGYGLVSTVMAVPVWLLACLARRLRGVKAWWLALILANGVTLTAAVVAFLRVSSVPA